MSSLEKLKIFKDKENEYHFNTKDNRIDIEHKEYLEFTISKWNGKASVKVSLSMVKSLFHSFNSLDNRIEVEDSKQKVRVFPIDIDDGGIRFEVVDKVPRSPINILRVPIVCENTRWSKQLALTQKEIDEGYFRPENIINTHSVYHANEKNNELGSGKMLQTYRVKVIDADGNWVWCDSDVDRYLDPTMIIYTAPMEFMENAVYPVTWDPDYGDTGIGGSWALLALVANAYRKASAWPIPSATVNYMRAYLSGIAGDTTDCKAVINEKDSGGPNIHDEEAGPVENLACAAAAHWEEFTFSGELLGSGTHLLGIIGKSGVSFGYQIAYDTDSAAASYNSASANYGAPPDPWLQPPEGTTLDLSIFANVTLLPAGGGGAGAAISASSLVTKLLFEGVIDD